MDKKKIIPVLALVFLGLFLLNTYTIYTSDDISYLYVFEGPLPGPGTKRVESLKGLVESIHNHYQMRNGRSLAHFLLQGSLALGPEFFNIINSLAFLILGLVMANLIFESKKTRTWQAYACLYSALFLFIPQFGPAVLWKSGAANYLWMAIFILLEVLAFVSWDRKRPFPKVLAIILGALAGAASENGAGMVIIVQVLFVLKWKRERRKIGLGLLLAIFASCLGLAYQVMAPGNMIRSGQAPDLDPMAHAILTLTKTGETIGIFLALYLILVLLYLVKRKKPPVEGLIFVLASLAGSLVLFFTPNLAERSWLWPVLFMIIALAYQARGLSFSLSRGQALALTLAFAGSALWVYKDAYISIKTSYAQNQEMLRDMEDQLASGNKNPAVKKFDLPTNPYNPLSQTYHLRESPDFWFNQWFAYYYGLESITITNPDQAR